MKYQYGWAFPDADTLMAAQIRPDGTYQGDHLAKALEFVTDFSGALDGGAHVGTWTALLSARFGAVHAFEPSADTFEALQANQQAFGWPNVQLHHAALGATRGVVSMGLDPAHAAIGNTGARFVQPGTDVAQLTIDSLQLPSLGFLKLDVEGGEVFALQGAKATLRRCQPVVLFENKFLWKRYGLPRQAPQSFLIDLGYRQVAIVSKDEIWAVPR